MSIEILNYACREYICINIRSQIIISDSLVYELITKSTNDFFIFSKYFKTRNFNHEVSNNRQYLIQFYLHSCCLTLMLRDRHIAVIPAGLATAEQRAQQGDK